MDEDKPEGDEGRAVKRYLKKLGNEGPDRHIELFLALIIAFFAGTQLVVSCHNNDSNTEQTKSAH